MTVDGVKDWEGEFAFGEIFTERFGLHVRDAAGRVRETERGRDERDRERGPE
jgi:hypothetical protein